MKDFEYNDDIYSEKEFDREFDRPLAYKVHEPKVIGLQGATIQELKSLLFDFASEFDLSVIDECTSEQIVEVIDIYCSSSNNAVPVF